jgi:hypothetical protein
MDVLIGKAKLKIKILFYSQMVTSVGQLAKSGKALRGRDFASLTWPKALQ